MFNNSNFTFSLLKFDSTSVFEGVLGIFSCFCCCGHRPALRAFSGSKTSFDDIIAAALADTGDFNTKDASDKDPFRYYAVTVEIAPVWRVRIFHADLWNR